MGIAVPWFLFPSCPLGAVVEFLRRHEGAALRLDFVPTSAGSPPLPTIHALGGDGGSLDCFRSFHLHIQGWGF